MFVKFLKFQKFRITARKRSAWIDGNFNFQVLQFPISKIVYLMVKGHWRVFCAENIIYKYNIIYIINTYIIYIYIYIYDMCHWKTNQRYWTSENEPHKGEVLIASTLLVMKAYNIHQYTTKMYNTKQSSDIKKILEAFFLTIKMYIGFTTYVL